MAKETIQKNRADRETLPKCWKTHYFGNVVCGECVIESCCEMFTDRFGKNGKDNL